MNIALNIIRDADLWVPTHKAALIVGRHITWVKRNKDQFSFRRVGPKQRNLEFEFSSCLKVHSQLVQEKVLQLKTAS